MFVAVVMVLDRLVAVPQQAARIGQDVAAVKQMEAVAHILLRRVDTESKYLARLEGKLNSRQRPSGPAQRSGQALHTLLPEQGHGEVCLQGASKEASGSFGFWLDSYLQYDMQTTALQLHKQQQHSVSCSMIIGKSLAALNFA